MFDLHPLPEMNFCSFSTTLLSLHSPFLLNLLMFYILLLLLLLFFIVIVIYKTISKNI